MGEWTKHNKRIANTVTMKLKQSDSRLTVRAQT